MQLIYTTRKNNSKNKMKKKTAKIFFGSFRLHYNWCSNSSHVLPVPATVYEGLSPSATHLYYDSTWNCAEDCPDSQLSGYLQWLEEKKVNKNDDDDKFTAENDVVDPNEIDRLADLFIASCHEKFMLEKQESYRRFQEMLARSM